VANPPAPSVSGASISSTYNGSGSTGLSPSGVYTSLAVASGPSHGSASISGTTATYYPTSGYYGADSFTYTATGPGGTSSAATVSVTVANPPVTTINVYNNAYSLRDLANNGGYGGASGASFDFVVPSGTEIDGSMWTGYWPSGVTLHLIINGVVYGNGGSGGDGSCSVWQSPGNGSDGGAGIEVNAPITITVNGTLLGGGGGGAGANMYLDQGIYSMCGGGGGAGAPNGGAGSPGGGGADGAYGGPGGTGDDYWGATSGGSGGNVGSDGNGSNAWGGSGSPGAAGPSYRANGNSVTINGSGTY
jgi:hypothetical protein